MKIYSLEKLKLNSDFLYEIFDKTIRYTLNININDINALIVTSEYEGRIDLISMYLYGTPNFIEELMVYNNIINPFNIKAGDVIFYPSDSNGFSVLYAVDKVDNNQKDSILLMNKNKSTKKDSNRIGYPPTIKPDNIEQLSINYNNKKISILNKFK